MTQMNSANNAACSTNSSPHHQSVVAQSTTDDSSESHTSDNGDSKVGSEDGTLVTVDEATISTIRSSTPIRNVSLTYADAVKESMHEGEKNWTKWTKVERKRKHISKAQTTETVRQCSDIIIGKSRNADLRVAQVKITKRITKDGIFVSRLEAGTSAAHVAMHIYNASGISVRPEKLKTKYDTYTSFMIPARKDTRVYNTLMDAHLWPRGCLVKPFKHQAS